MALRDRLNLLMNLLNDHKYVDTKKGVTLATFNALKAKPQVLQKMDEPSFFLICHFIGSIYNEFIKGQPSDVPFSQVPQQADCFNFMQVLLVYCYSRLITYQVNSNSQPGFGCSTPDNGSFLAQQLHLIAYLLQ